MHARTIASLMEAGEVRGYTLQHERANFGIFYRIIACGECVWKWKMGDVVVSFIMRKDNTLITALNCFWNKGKLIFNLSLPRIIIDVNSLYWMLYISYNFISSRSDKQYPKAYIFLSLLENKLYWCHLEKLLFGLKWECNKV